MTQQPVRIEKNKLVYDVKSMATGKLYHITWNGVEHVVQRVGDKVRVYKKV